MTTVGRIGTVDFGATLKRQIDMEMSSIQAGVQRYRQLAQDAIEQGEGAGLKAAERLLLYWIEPLTEAIRQEQRECRNGEPSVGRHVYGPVLCLVDPAKVALIVLNRAVSACMAEPDGAAVAQLAYSIGAAVTAEASLDMMRDECTDDLRELTKRVKKLTPKKIVHWSNRCLSDPIWNRKVCMHMGSFLLWSLQDTASIGGYQQDNWKVAFRHEKRSAGRKRKGFFVMAPEVFEALEDGHAIRELLRPKHMPMIVRPREWCHKNRGTELRVDGGYEKIRTPYVIKATKTQRDAYARADLSRPDACLNAVSSVGWQINHSLVEVVNELYDRGGGIAGVPLRDDKPRPERPVDADSDKAISKAWRRDAARVRAENRAMRSLRHELAVTLGIADSMSSLDAFYLPHRYCFRGRVYPIPTHLHHHSNDVARSMLMFSDAIDATENESRFWLYVHAANCAGIDKASFEDRVAWVDAWITSHKAGTWLGSAESIADAAAETWAQEDIDKPLQFLAAVLAIFVPEQAAHLPVQLDGTCSALQHYAALAGDHEVAALCNLVDGEKPSDVYGVNGAEMGAIVARDAANPHSSGHQSAMIMLGRCGRSIAKSPSMTRYYGATSYGIHDQLMVKLMDIGKKEPDTGLADFKLAHRVANYLGGVATEAIGKVCKSADVIMDWLRTGAHGIAMSGECAAWTAPLGLPVVQPYRSYATKQIKTCLQYITMLVEDEKMPVKIGKQARACAPNFVHSLDASHGLAVMLEMESRGMPGALVHDSFWMHAANAGRGGAIIRERFVDQYQTDHLDKLYREWTLRYPSVKLSPPPARGNFDVQHVLKARYAFS